MNRVSRRTAAAVAGGAAMVALAVGGGAGAAQAEPFTPPPNYWCPGQALPFDNIRWDINVCHTWYIVPFDVGNVRMVDLKGNDLDSFIYSGDTPPLLTPPPPPPGKPPGTPFCSPRGALIIIPPICDEIGVDWPPGSVRN